MLEKILRTCILTAGIGLSLAGCRTTEPEVPVFEILGSAVMLAPEKTKTPEEILAEQEEKIAQIKQIIAENKVEYIDDVFLYTDEGKEELFKALRQKYGFVEEKIEQYRKVLDALQNQYSALVLFPSDETGQGRKSTACFFKRMRQEIQTKGDLQSLVVDYAGHIAKLNADGLTIEGRKINPAETGIPLYHEILQLQARINQLKKGEISDKYRMYIAAHCVMLKMFFSIEAVRNEYARMMLNETEKAMVLAGVQIVDIK